METMNVYKKLQEARTLLQKRPIKKSWYNSYSKYHYYELSDFMPAINEIFNDVGLVSCLNIKSDVAELSIVNSDKPEEQATFTIPVPAAGEMKGTSPLQATGAMCTYMTRYLFLNALQIAENDVVDRPVATQPQPLAQANGARPAAQQLASKSTEQEPLPTMMRIAQRG